ncbi:uncharacterized protein CLUP02_15884 [Colletotrichum lupini]|uniref:Uncharacterized protein n=1 Tax=Colletotrichum lupini TaxID=145971 RepID=A0A9Q8WNZ1_9PEZI|nr:uncharacterized protein CLUP02_15884 [Colletotrichum lupini]UQC90354.1 hypothetical protein CLUP02_15884 [Colletotrichum lupini]
MHLHIGLEADLALTLATPSAGGGNVVDRARDTMIGLCSELSWERVVVGMPSMRPCATLGMLVQSSACIRIMAAAVSSLSLIYSKYGLVTSTAATHFGITTSLGSFALLPTLLAASQKPPIHAMATLFVT